MQRLNTPNETNHKGESLFKRCIEDMILIREKQIAKLLIYSWLIDLDDPKLFTEKE
ncbi:25464_t:CDS:2 [Gigaspora margarita]|uniref:25464_t:CDS:1 n=1 Tax=Gigaspora margarita TaxID=4874 RepID=A0ABN7UD91_GIGMA|nr:25464_t:CDS:2 [Gigaspora margarita]